jgi:acetylornithine deacetylase/succinyl-diaminopimelate desuccinylase-like protein
MTEAPLTKEDRDLLLHLLGLPTAGPLETQGETSPLRLWEAQSAYAAAAAEIGFETVHHGSAEPGVLERDDVPLAVRRAAEEVPGFLKSQPSLVLRLGPSLPRRATVMFNVHLDTVAGWEPPRFDGARFHGRGAIDAKGPAVALLAGLRAAVAAEPALGRDTGVIIQAVAGEEGGAMGTFGTRPLVETGHVGRLNIFCEPTGLRYLPRSTASMTACLRVRGRDSIDDMPEAGHNASVLLGFLAQHLATALPDAATDGRICIAGLRTGPLHNRVYGEGRLFLNLSYGRVETGRAVRAKLIHAFHDGLDAFAERFGGVRDFALTAAEARSITTLEWHKKDLPALTNADPWAESLMSDAGIDRWPDDLPAFTCDAIWMNAVPGTYTAVCGPGDLQANNAHAAGEHADLGELERFGSRIGRLAGSFSRSWSEH